MALIVAKFGGTSVASPERIKNVAKRLVGMRQRGDEVVAVVPAMGKTTDELMGLASAITTAPPARELDRLLSTGEQGSMTLLAMAIEALGYNSISLTSRQAGIKTNNTHNKMRRREDGTEVKVEVTTYRSDTYDPDSRKPEVNYGDTLEGDLSRRDFTVNAMALRVPELEFVDPFGGANDLAKGVLRTPVDPRQSFDDDPLRMMRAVRFVAQLGFRIEPETAEALSDMVDRIEIVSAERVRDELVKLLLSDRPRAGIEALVDSGLADIVLPEIPALQLEIDEHHRHKDVFEHTMIVIERAVALETGPDGPVPAPDLTLRLAALLHDIGKPKTRRFEAGGKVSFHRHDAVGAKMTRKRLKALHFDHHMVEDVSELVNLHLRFHGYVEEPWTDSAVRRYVKDAGPLYERLNRLTRADTTTQNKRKAMMFSAAMDEMEQRVRDLKEKEDFDAIRPDLNGDEIMQLLSIEPGPMVGKAYKHMLEYRLDNGPVERDVAVAELERWYKEQGE